MATNTRDTTQIDSAIMGLLMAALASAMLIYSLKYASATIAHVDTEARYNAVTAGVVPTELELDALTRLLRTTPNPSDLSKAAFLQLIRAQQSGIKSIRALPRLIGARRDLLKGIAASPSDAYAWTRLAVAEVELEHFPEAAKALSMAMQLAPADQGLASMHFDLGVVLWNRLDAAAKASLAQRLKWASRKPELSHVVQGNSARALREKLSTKP